MITAFPLHAGAPVRRHAPAMRRLFLPLAALLASCALAPAAFAVGGPRYVEFSPGAGSFALVEGGQAANLGVDPADWPGVVRAVRDLQADVARVSGLTPAITNEASPGATAVIVGTLGRSGLIDRLAREGRIDGSRLAGKWETFLTQVVADPLPGVSRALVIAGSDKRGTIYGIYDLSEQIGVSPWYWWADVPSEHHDALYVRAGTTVQGPPSVKYRGIFLNDEAPDLTNWVAAKYGMVGRRDNPPIPDGATVANYGREFHKRLFEVMLRLRANYLWPAMWNNAFNEDDPENPRLADEYGIVMGTSHQEAMLRAQREWDRRYRATLGTWNYATQRDVLESFWREGIRRNRDWENIITIGLRGANDTPMAPGGPDANRALLETIIERQRDILREEMNPDITQVPQLWCLYKEVQEFYEAGMRVPDDVILLWAEDNWGNVRRLPTAEERHRSGGAGVYYHFDYHGGPRSYQWINTSPIPKIWDQMSLSKDYGADRVWIVNVGHFKGYEIPLEYFLDLGWDTTRWTAGNTREFTRLWAEREFGPAHADEIADIVTKYTRYNGRRKPEMLAPDTYSLVNYGEAETVVADFNAIADQAQVIHDQLPAEYRDAFYQLVLFPTKACAVVNELYFAAGRNALFARQGRASAPDMAAGTRALFDEDMAMMDHFNRTLAGGKWDHFMDQPHLGYTTWRDPPTNSLNHLTLVEPAVPAAAALGVAVEGSASAWPGAAGQPALPRFDALNQQRRPVDVFNRGRASFAFTATASAPWIVLSQTQGTVEKDHRLWVSVDWDAAPAGAATGTVTIAGAGASVTVAIPALKPAEVTRATLEGFAEADGYVSIEPEHATRKIEAGSFRWSKIDDYGRTLSGMRAEAPIDAPSATPPAGAACLEYRMYLFSGGRVEVNTIVSPTLNFVPGRGLRYAVSFDDEAPQVVTLVPDGFQAAHSNMDWERTVADNARTGLSTHTLAGPGYHTLKLWTVDPGVVLQKLVVDCGGLRPSYLGPPETFRGAGRPAISGQPVSQTVAPGQSVSLVVRAAGEGLAYQWRRNGVAIDGAIEPMLSLAAFSADLVGSYDVVVTNAAGSVTSAAATLGIGPGDRSRLGNLSSRAQIGSGDAVAICGFAIAGNAPQTVLIRGVGPGLATFGVGGILANPRLTLFLGDEAIAVNEGWQTGDAVQIRAESARLQAFALPEDGRDCAMLATLEPGAYTAHLAGRDGGSGIGLVEVYDASSDDARHLVNLSARAAVGRGDDVLISGLVVTGSSPQTLLVRAVGTGLSDYGVHDVLARPRVTVFAGSEPIVQNIGWSTAVNADAIAAVAARVGAFALDPAGADSALLVTLQPGSYTIHASGADGGTGVALAEVYAVSASL